MRPVRLPGTEKKRQKYGAKPQRIDGQHFASQREAKQWFTLKMRERIGEIRNLRPQPRFLLMAAVLGPDALDNINRPIIGMRAVGEYRADATYEERHGAEWARIVEDTKGHRTQVYLLKRRMFEAQYDMQIREV